MQRDPGPETPFLEGRDQVCDWGHWAEEFDMGLRECKAGLGKEKVFLGDPLLGKRQ